MKKSIIAKVFSRGRVYKGDEGVMYDGPPAKFVNISGVRTLELLRSKIAERLTLNSNEKVTTIVYRFPIEDNKFEAFKLADDDDLVCGIAAYKDNRRNAMELYIDIAEVECDNAGPSNIGDLGESQGIGVNSRIISASSKAPCLVHMDAIADVNITTGYHPVFNSSVAGISPIRTEHVRDTVGGIDNDDSDVDELENGVDVATESDIGDEECSPNDDGSDDDSDEPIDNQEVHGPNPLMCAPIGLFREHSVPSSAACLPTGPYSQPSVPFTHSTIPPVIGNTFINWDVLGAESDFPDIVNCTDAANNDEIYMGRQFESKSALIHALKLYHVQRHYSYKVVESSTGKLSIRCLYYGDHCHFAVRASNFKNQGIWRITRFSGPHECVNPSLSEDHKLLDSEFICSFVMEMIKVQQDVPIALIQERIHSTLGYKVSYKKAWKAKQKAIVRVYGDWYKSYEILPQFLDMLQYCDNVTYVLECDAFETANHRVDGSKRVFNRLFWAFKPSIAAFPHCKKFIQVDGTHLYGKHKGTLLIAATQDGNRCPVPLAFAIVSKENNDNWSWFLRLLRIHVTRARGICLISDRHVSIIHAVANDHEWQPPYAYHCFCIRHIGSNVRERCKDDNVRNFVIRIAYEPRQDKVQSKLENLRKMNADIHTRMTDIPLEKWCLAYDEGRRYGHMTTNIVECINGILKGVRKLPITGLVQNTFYRCVKYWVDRGLQTRNEISAGNLYTTKFIKQIETIKSRASGFHVRAFNIDGTRFEVVEGHDPLTGLCGRIVQVQLDQRWCECGHFQAFHYPCSHVIAACTSRNVSWDPYVDDVYKLENVERCYAQNWWPLGDFTGWRNVDDQRVVVPNPARLRDRGRPKTTRIKNAMDWPQEPGVRQKCRYCKKEGHNRRKCPEFISNHSSSTLT